jgi:hypothetical protein
MNTTTLFFELIQVSMGTRDTLSRAPSADEWTSLYKTAKKQALVGVCFEGVQRLFDKHREIVESFPNGLKMKWIGSEAATRGRNELLNLRCVEMQNRLSKDGFRTYIMKGQGNAALYGNGLNMLRQPGDIDIFLEGGYKRVMKYVGETYPTREVNELEIHYHCFQDVPVEIHYRPFIMRDPIKNARLQRFFRSENERCFTNAIELPNGIGTITAPTPTFNIVHQLVHIKHHLFTEGIGLRQLMDYCFVLREAKAKPFDTAYVLQVISSLGLDCFAKSLMWVLQTVFALEDEALFWTPDEKHGKLLLDEILRSGNFGQMSGEKRPKGLLGSFFYVNAKTLRFACFDSSAWFWTPLWRLWHFCWRKVNGYK